MASSTVEFKRSAEKDLGRISKDQIPRILAAVRALADDPLPQGSKKLVGSDLTYRIRVGDYRVIYQFHRARNVIEISRVRHRREVYRD
jgi:mRNA interferase RelE/StbE